MNKLCLIAIFLVVTGLVACLSPSDKNTEVQVTTEAANIAQTKISTPNPANSKTLGTKPLEKVRSNHREVLETTVFSDAPDRDLFRLTKELVPGVGDISRTVTSDAAEYKAGRIDTFWLVNLENVEAYQADFELVLVTPNAYWYVEKDLDISLSGIENSASVFEEEIYPVTTRIFGSEWNPGIDNDPHLNILNASLNGVAGYYSSTDEYPASVRSKSNEREIIYINAQDVSPGGHHYEQVLSHELQHAIHWNLDSSEDTWINEGLAELSSSIALGSSLSIGHFLRSPPISLTTWPTSSVGSIAHYGAASLFMHFLTEHYGGQDNLKALVSQNEDGIAGVDAYLKEMGYEARFEDLFREWAAANIIDGEDILGYDELIVKAHITGSIRGLGYSESKIPQYAVEYTRLRPTSEPFTLSFQGPTTVPLLPLDIGVSGCWWGNSGDSIDSTLSHKVRVPADSLTTLDYDIWFEIEEDWDYLYVEASVDGGQTWTIIETPSTSQENPIGNSFGPGYTGKSHGWIMESIDLSPYAGQDIRVRFQYITDDAVNAAGACIRNLEIYAAGITLDNQDWQANGFVFTNNLVRQDFQIQLITIGEDPQVHQVSLNTENTAEINVVPPENGQELIVSVGALAEKTRHLASYTLTVSNTQ